MKRIRSIGNYVICQSSVSDKKNICTSEYLLITKEEMQYSPQMREIEFEADNIQELIDFVSPEPFHSLAEQVESFKDYIDEMSAKYKSDESIKLHSAIGFFKDYKDVFNLLCLVGGVDSKDTKKRLDRI